MIFFGRGRGCGCGCGWWGGREGENANSPARCRWGREWEWDWVRIGDGLIKGVGLGWSVLGLLLLPAGKWEIEIGGWWMDWCRKWWKSFRCWGGDREWRMGVYGLMTVGGYFVCGRQRWLGGPKSVRARSLFARRSFYLRAENDVVALINTEWYEDTALVTSVWPQSGQKPDSNFPTT